MQKNCMDTILDVLINVDSAIVHTFFITSLITVSKKNNFSVSIKKSISKKYF